MPEPFPASIRNVEIENFYPFETVWSARGLDLQDGRRLEFLGILINKVLSMVHTLSKAKEFLGFCLDRCIQTNHPGTGKHGRLENAEKLYWLLVSKYLIPYAKTKENDCFSKCLNSHELFAYTIGKIRPGNPISFFTSVLDKTFDILGASKASSDSTLVDSLRECLAKLEHVCGCLVERLSVNPPTEPEHSVDSMGPVLGALEHFKTIATELVQEILERESGAKSCVEALANELRVIHSFISMVGSFFLESSCFEDCFALNLSHSINKCIMHILSSCCGSSADFYIMLIDFYDKKLRPIAAEEEDNEIRQLYAFYLSEVWERCSVTSQNEIALAEKLQYLRIFSAYRSTIKDHSFCRALPSIRCSS